MRIAERILLIMAIVGVVFKVLHWPGAGLMIVFGVSGLAVLYFALGLLVFRAKKSKINLPALAIPAGFALAAALMGILFKLQHWPGSHTALVAGAFLSLVIIVPLSLRFMKKHRDHNEEYVVSKKNINALDTVETSIIVERAKYKYGKNIFLRAIIIGMLAAAVYALPWSVYNRFQYWHDPEYARLMTRFDEDPGNPEHWKALEEYRAKKYNYSLYEEQQAPGNEQVSE